MSTGPTGNVKNLSPQQIMLLSSYLPGVTGANLIAKIYSTPGTGPTGQLNDGQVAVLTTTITGPTGTAIVDFVNGGTMNPNPEPYPSYPINPALNPRVMFPSRTGPSQNPQYIATISELLTSYEATQLHEAKDKTTLSVLLTENGNTLRNPLFQWAALGFPDIYILHSFTVTPPAVCADGVTRNMIEYIQYLLETDLTTLITGLQSRLLGIQVSFSILGQAFRIHVSRI